MTCRSRTRGAPAQPSGVFTDVREGGIAECARGTARPDAAVHRTASGPQDMSLESVWRRRDSRAVETGFRRRMRWFLRHPDSVTSVGGLVASDPKIVVSHGRFDVFVRGDDGRIYPCGSRGPLAITTTMGSQPQMSAPDRTSLVRRGQVERAATGERRSKAGRRGVPSIPCLPPSRWKAHAARKEGSPPPGQGCGGSAAPAAWLST